MHLTINGQQIEATDCRSWQVVGMTPTCTLGLPLDCASCARRESRRGDGTDPPIYQVPSAAIRAPRTPAKPPPPPPGLGDVVAGATKAVGIKPCGKCKQRQAALNRATPSYVKRVLAWARNFPIPGRK